MARIAPQPAGAALPSAVRWDKLAADVTKTVRAQYAMIPRMNRVLVRYLLWVLIAALPLQGFAAAIKTCCGSSHANAAYSIDQQAVHDHAPGHSHMAAHAHGKCSTCSHCASCCLGAAALPSTPVFTPVFLTAPAVVLAPAPWVTGYIPDGLERPPRPFSA
jgi:hypothetical protein